MLNWLLPLPVAVGTQVEPEVIRNETLDPARMYVGTFGYTGSVVARLRPGITLNAAREDLSRILESEAPLYVAYSKCLRADTA